MKLRPPAGQDRTAPDSDGHGAKNRGVTAAENGLERTGMDSQCQSVSALVAAAIEALDIGDAARARARLRELEKVLTAQG